MTSSELADVFERRAEEAWPRLVYARADGKPLQVVRHWERVYNRLSRAVRYLRRRAKGE